MSISLKSGKIVEIVCFAVVAVATYYYLWRAIKGKPQKLRELAAVAAVSDGVDKAVEEGKPIFVSPGNMAYLSGVYLPMSVAGMNFARYTAKMAVRRGARIIFPVPYNPEMMPLIDGIFREVCVSEGKPQAYRREDVRYYGSQEYSFAIGCCRDIAVEGCSLMVAVGANSTCENETMGIAYLDGALIIAGTARWGHQSSTIVQADYPLFMEDLYSAGAYVTGDDVVCSSLVGNDVFKLVIIGLFIVATVLTLAGLPAVSKGGWFFQ